MKLLFDADLSPKLVERLAELYPGSAHVFDTGLQTLWSSPDAERVATIGPVFTSTLRSRVAKAIEVFWIRAEIRAQALDGLDQSRPLCALVGGHFSVLSRELPPNCFANYLRLAHTISLGVVVQSSPQLGGEAHRNSAVFHLI